MKPFAIVLFGSALALSVTAASADPIKRRERHQAARIRQGERSGELTPREAAKLEGEEQAVDAERKAAAADGHISRGERKAIRRDQREVSHEIYRKKHNERKVE